LLLFVVLALVLLGLPLVLEAPDLARRLTHPLEYEETIRDAAAESGFDPDVESSQGAYGLMQIQPETAGFISERGGIAGDYRGPKTNIRMGTWYLNYLQNRYEGDERLVLAAYNSGEGQVDAWVSEEGFDVYRDIPFEETHQYVEDVSAARDVYEELYGSDLDRRSEE
jgi:soluble lytic murein transglycosylase